MANTSNLGVGLNITSVAWFLNGCIILILDRSEVALGLGSVLREDLTAFSQEVLARPLRFKLIHQRLAGCIVITGDIESLTRLLAWNR